MYAVLADVRGVLSPDGQQDGYETAAGFSDAALEHAITRAVTKSHAYLGERYALPVDVTNDPDGLLRDWTSVLAAYYATLTYSRAAARRAILQFRHREAGPRGIDALGLVAQILLSIVPAGLGLIVL